METREDLIKEILANDKWATERELKKMKKKELLQIRQFLVNCAMSTQIFVDDFPDS